MCVHGKPATVAASSSGAERVCSEQHRVDEINLSEKFQSIGAGDPKRRWLVDSGATCHIISERCVVTLQGCSSMKLAFLS